MKRVDGKGTEAAEVWGEVGTWGSGRGVCGTYTLPRHPCPFAGGCAFSGTPLWSSADNGTWTQLWLSHLGLSRAWLPV